MELEPADEMVVSENLEVFKASGFELSVDDEAPPGQVLLLSHPLTVSILSFPFLSFYSELPFPSILSFPFLSFYYELSFPSILSFPFLSFYSELPFPSILSFPSLSFYSELPLLCPFRAFLS